MKEPYEVADILEEIYERRFGDKDYGRYKISKTLFKQLCERKYLRESFLNQVIDEAIEDGLVVIPLEHSIVVIKEKTLLNCRSVPEDLVSELIDEWDEDEELEDEEDEDDEWDDEDEDEGNGE